MKYIRLLHLSGTTLSLVRRTYHEGPHFSASRALPPPYKIGRRTATIKYIKYDSSCCTGTIDGSLQYFLRREDSRALPQRSGSGSHPIRAKGSVLRSCSEKSFFPPGMYKKNKQLSV